ncbi:MAG: FKBP-type peptidyl-prolyl cis-trans isomerase [Henriciella sp.]|nr:FKBP-type peptidyl-prolyl cis-trans isomerase [Henriciella sp.]
MSATRSTILLAAGALALTGCETLPALPGGTTGVFTGVSSAPCPAYAPGPSEFTAPFPAKCDEMELSASGLRWIPIKSGDTSRGTPGPDATVVVNYEGFLAQDGVKIDSSYSRGESSVYTVPELLDGWGEVIQKMSPGDEWLVFIPSELAFGSEAVGELIPANADVVFQVELEGFLSAADLAAASGADAAAEAPQAVVVEAAGPDMPAWQAFLPWDPNKPGINQLPSGVAYVTLEDGKSESRNALVGDQVVVHYEGRLAETTEFFDSSWSRGAPAEFEVGKLIPGFDEVLTYMRPGDRVLAFMPAAQAYGADGAGEDIPPNADLVFQINLMAITEPVSE